MNSKLIYVYCMTNKPPDPVCSYKYVDLKTLVFTDYCIYIKYVSENEYSIENLKKNLADLQWLEKNAREHVNVIRMVMEHNTVIPFKFGTIFYTESNLQKFITDFYDSLSVNFDFIDGKEEWTVKIYCNRKALSEQIDQLSEEAAALEKQIMTSSPGKAFLLKRKKTDLIELELDKLCKTYGQTYFNEFKNLSESTVLNNLLPKEFTGRQDTMILNSTFLVNKSKVADFKQIIDTLENKMVQSGFFIDATGPWPPFSFIAIKENTDVR